MKRTWIALLVLALLGGGTDWVSAAIIQRIIHAGDTPLTSTCLVTQTAPMELTISACSFTTTGQAKIVNVAKVIGSLADRTLPDFAGRFKSGMDELQNRVLAGDIEYMPDGKRVRGWLRDRQGNIIEKSKTHVRNVATTVTVPGPGWWVIYLLGGPGVNLDVVLQLL